MRWETENWRPRLALGSERPNWVFFFLHGVLFGWRETPLVWVLDLNITKLQEDAFEGEDLVGCSPERGTGSLGPSAGPVTNQV